MLMLKLMLGVNGAIETGGVFPKHLINHWSINWAQVKDPVVTTRGRRTSNYIRQ